MKKVCVAFLLAAIAFACSCEADSIDKYTAYASAMDTNAVITVYGDGCEEMANECVNMLYLLESEFSVTASGSKVASLNKGNTVDSDGDFYELCTLADELYRLTQGAYNPCIYPLVKLWGFTTGAYRVPTEEELFSALSLVKESRLVAENGTVTIDGDGQIDLGGIAKGYAAEQLKGYLADDGAEGAIISLGGNIVTVGSKPDGTPWSVGINSPSRDGSLLGVLEVDECAIVTSGSYMRNFELDGAVYHHIIDPETGKPVENGLVSVTVVADDSTLADGLSTAFFVLGMDKSKALAEEMGVDTVFVTENSIYISQGLKEKFAPDASVEGKYEIIYN